MLTVLDDDGLNWWEIPNLMSMWSRSIELQFTAAASAAFGNTVHNGRALLTWNQFANVSFVTILLALFPLLSPRFLPGRLSVRMFGTWWNRGITRRQAANLLGSIPDLRLEHSNPCLVKRNQLLEEHASRFGFWWQFDSFSGSVHSRI